MQRSGFTKVCASRLISDGYKQATFSVRLFTVSSVLPVIITSPVLIRNKCQTSRAPLTCSEMTGNRIEQPGISCISQPSKKEGLTTGNKSKPDGKSIMWWRGIMTNSRRKDFLWEDNALRNWLKSQNISLRIEYSKEVSIRNTTNKKRTTNCFVVLFCLGRKTPLLNKPSILVVFIEPSTGFPV